MSRQRFGVIFLLALTLIVVLATPVAAQTGEQGKLVVGGAYVLRSGERLNGDLGVIGGTATVEQGATVDGDILVAGGVLNLAGRVSGDIAVFGGVVTLESTARVAGDLVSFGGAVERNAGAVVQGDVREGGAFDIPGWRGPIPPVIEGITPRPEVSLQQSPGQWLALMFWRALRSGLLILALTALALVVALLWPKGIERLGQTVTAQPVMALLVGLLSWVVGIGLLVLLAVTICLIPVALLLGLVLLVAGLLSWVVSGWLLGRKLLAALNLRNSTLVLEAALGTLLLAIVYFLLNTIACLGFVVGLLVASFGLGAIVLTRFGTRPYPSVQPIGSDAVLVEPAPALPDQDEPPPPPQLTGR